MQDDQFEWDDIKAARNRREHDVTFELAREAFKDVFAVEWADDRHHAPEERVNMPAMVESRLLHITYTLRGERTRIISAQKPEPHERRRYHDENREV